MVKDTLSSEKGKKEEHIFSKGRAICTRYSASQSNSGKSERIEKKNAPSPPLWRSCRGNSVSSLDTSVSRRSGASSDTDQRKNKKEESVEELTSQIRKCKPVMTGRAYRALFTRQPKRSEYLADQHGNKDNDMVQVDGSETDQKSAKDRAETFAQVPREDPLEQAASPSPPSVHENDHGEGVSARPNAEEVGVAVTSFIADDEISGAENVGLDCQHLENQEPQRLVADLIGARKDADSSLKRKRNTAVVLDAPTMVAKGDDCTMSSEGIVTSTYGCKNVNHPETCNMCQKRQKVDHDSSNLANCSCSTKPDLEFGCMVQDRGKTEAAVNKDFGGTNEETIQQDESHDCKADSSSYPEYWVPVQISDIQLEQYCATLLSNSSPLCSLSNKELVGELHNTLNSVRKSCNHPYAVDESVRSLVIKNLKGTEILDVEIKASGKLQLLDAMLTEIRKKGLKTVVFFQGLTGDLLDLFMRQRFGESSYERIDRNVSVSKKQCSMNKFNKESERFVLLLEIRACSNSIKLSSVEAFILFDSSWNPSQDLRLLQKIKIESQSEKTKTFRLYSSCTVEEKALLLATQNKPVADNPSHLIIHDLLMWGASYLFDKLDHFHSKQNLESGLLFEQSIIEGVIDEILSILSSRSGDKKKSRQCLISEANYAQGSYCTDFTLFGESKVKLSGEDCPNIFWTKLLNQRNPTWRYCSVSSQRVRKRINYLENSETSSEVANEVLLLAKKHKKATGDSSDPPALHEEENASGKDPKEALLSSRSTSGTDDLMHASDAFGLYSLGGTVSEIPEDMLAGNDGRKGLCESQKSLQCSLKPEMAKLCRVLHLSADVMSVVENFFEFVISNHHVCKEPTTVLQAFQIAMCWVAATLLKQNLNRKETLSLAKDHLAYGCSREVVDYIYYMLCCLRSIFLKSKWGSRLDCLPKDSEQTVEGTSRNQVDQHTPQWLPLQEKENAEKAGGTESLACLSKLRGTDDGSIRKDIEKSIKSFRKKWSKQVKNLRAKHDEEKMELERNYEKEKSDLEKSKKAKALVINIAWKAGSVQSKKDELNAMNCDFERKFDQLKNRMTESLKNLEEKHEAERKKVAEYEADWIKRLDRWAEDLLGLMLSKSEHSSGIIPSRSIGNAPDIARTCNDPAVDVSGYEERRYAMDPLAKVQNKRGTTAVDDSELDVPETARNSREDILQITSSTKPESRSSGPTSATELEICAAADCQEKVAALNVLLPEDKIRDGMTPRAPGEVATLRVLEISQPLESGVLSDPPLNRAQGLLLVENNGTGNLSASSAHVVDKPDEETCSPDQELPGESALPLEHPVPGVMSGSCAVRDQAAHGMCPQPSSLAGTQHDPAPNAESQNIEEAAEPDSREVEVAEPSVAEPDTNEVEVAESLRRSSNEGVVSQNTETLTCLAENLVELAEEGVVEPSAGVAGEQPATCQGISMNNHVPQSSAQAAPQRPYSLQGDPFHYEVDKIQRELEEATKIHEDTKSQLKAEFERKTAELRREYDNKYREEDTKLQARAKELENYKNLVVMNKYLAEDFKFKCSVPNEASATATSGDMNTDTIQLLAQQPVPAQAQRNSAATHHPSITSMAPPQSQSTVPPQPRSHVSPVSHSLGSSVPQSRPPVITNTAPSPASPSPGSITPPVSRGVRAPAPHLQSYRPSAANNGQQRASHISRPATVPGPNAGEAAELSVGSSTAATYSSMLIQHLPQRGQEQRGNSITCVLQCSGDVVCLSDDE